jgi:hypothetical protein
MILPNKILCLTVFFALAFFPSWENCLQKRTGRAFQLVPSLYGVQFPVQATPLPLEDQESTSGTETELVSGEENSIANSATCGRPWQKQLTQVEGRIRTIEYRVQPITRRTGLHIDVEKDGEEYAVIHVYPEKLIEKCPSVFDFVVGDTVKVSGSEFFTGRDGEQQNICAATLTQQEKILKVRNPVTGSLERQLCCQAICKKNCNGLPPMCGLMCMGNCKNERLKAALQGGPFCPSCDNDYAATILGF